MAQYVEQKVNSGQFASTSDFFRQLVREYQAKAAERWVDRLIEQRRDSAQFEDNLIPQEEMERKVLGRTITEPS